MEEESKNRTNLIVSQTQHFKLAENVYGRVLVKNMQPNKINPYQIDQFHPFGNQMNVQQEQTREFEVIIQSKVLSMNELRSMVQVWVKEYLEHMKPDKELHFFQS